MISIDEMQGMLGELLDELPPAFFEELNGGVTLVEEAKSDDAAEELYILGEYVEDMLGCSIVLYYGSFLGLLEGSTRAQVRRELRHTLRHEFRHHMEARAGVDDLDVQDARELAEFIRQDEARRAPEESARQALERGRRDGEKLLRQNKRRGLFFWKQ